MYKNKLRDFVPCVGILLLGGCASIGPNSVKQVHYEYNNVITKTNNEQLLLNIVRTKYRDPLCFLNINDISECRKFTTRVGPSGTKIGFDKNAGNIDLGILAYSEIFQNPTIHYIPLRGEEFTKCMISPIPLSAVFGLVQAGWNPKLVFNLCIECFNHLDNASTASGPTPSKKPDYEDFAKAVDLMDTLYEQKCLLIGLSSENQKDLILKFTNSNSQSQELKALLGIDRDSSEFRFHSNFFDAFTGLNVRTRSVMEVLFYLSHAVCVPQKDIDGGLVTVTKDSAGKIFNWNKCLSGEWISVHCSEGRERPQNAFVSVFYREKWFYITDNDLISKSTFIFLNYLFNLQSGNSMAFTPTLRVATN